MTFPKVVYVRIEKDSRGEEEYMVASETADGENGERVGVYTLKEIKKRKIVESLE